MPLHRSRRSLRRPARLLAIFGVVATVSGVALVGAWAGTSETGLQVSVTGPTDPTVRATVTVTASASAPSGVRRVEFLVDGRMLGSDTTSPYSVNGDSTRLSDGAHTVTARVTSNGGAAATSTGRRVVVDNSPATPPTDPRSNLETAWTAPAGGVFGPGSVWKQVVRGAPVAANSATQVGNISWSVNHNYNGVAAFNVWDYNTAVAVVGSGQRRSRVHWDDCQHKGSLPGGVYGPGGQFEDVPVPDNAKVASGSDRELTIYSPSSDQVWEFWVTARQSDGWHACWGGRIDHASTSPGFFTRGFGATATGLPYVAGMVSIADARRGYIDHALALQIIDTADWWKISYPAQRGDGAGNGPIREGTRFRLDPGINVDSLGLNRYAAMVAKAAQQYGFIVVDKGGAVAVIAESGNGVAGNGGTNPWTSMLGSTPSYAVMKNFPWDRLQALPTDWGKPQ